MGQIFYTYCSFGVSQIFIAFLNYQKLNRIFFYNNDNNNIYRRAKRIQIPISVHYPIFSTRHRNHFEQQMSKSSSFMIFSAAISSVPNKWNYWNWTVKLFDYFLKFQCQWNFLIRIMNHFIKITRSYYIVSFFE